MTEAQKISGAEDIYDASIVTHEGLTLWLGRDGRLGVVAERGLPLLQRFEGTSEPFEGDRVLVRSEKNEKNARALRAALPWLEPRPLGLATSSGFGDRLGLATPGHAKAAARFENVSPIFAQQSIREMTRTKRTPQEVMTDATWGAFEAGWRGEVGADADHLKTTDDIDACIEAGFSFFTLDPGDFVDDEAQTADAQTLREKAEALPWDALESSLKDLLTRYRGHSFDLETGRLELSEENLLRAVTKYGRALAQVARLYRHLEGKGVSFELEVSVDETSYPTTPAEHALIASELGRLGVSFVSLAPRYVGGFEKGVDYIGDLGELEKNLNVHAEIARALGPYKLSLHSGSDKFSVYPLFAHATRGLLHLKTAGTSYLEALRVLAVYSPDLFKEILRLGLERFQEDRKSYHLSCDPARVPEPQTLAEDDLPGLLNDNDARQVLHVTYGSALDAFGTQIEGVLREHEAAHYEALERHFVRHLEPLVRRDV